MMALEIPQSKYGGCSFSGGERCFDVEVYSLMRRSVETRSHGVSHFVKRLSEKHCKEHEAQF